MSPPDRELTRRDLDRKDRQNQLRKIGYHWVIRRDGVVEAGRDESEGSMHDGVHESKLCVSVCLIGGVSADGEPEDNFTFAQRTALSKLVHEVYLRYPEMQQQSWNAVELKTPSLERETVLAWLQ